MTDAIILKAPIEDGSMAGVERDDFHLLGREAWEGLGGRCDLQGDSR